MRIFKYPLDVLYRSPDTNLYNIDMPAGARVLCAQEQNGTICLWAEIDESRRAEERQFAKVGTGGPDLNKWVTNRMRYIDTVQVLERGYDQPFVWHIYEMMKSPTKDRVRAAAERANEAP